MYVGIYQEANALSGLEQWQAAITQNLSNSSTAGFKTTEFGFSAEPSMAARYANNGNPSAEAANVILQAGANISYQQGQLIESGSPTDLALKGKGFFVLENDAGETLYTRNGQFTMNDRNELINSDGFRVMAGNGGLRLTPGNGPMSVDRTGRVFQNNLPVGRLTVVDFTDYDGLNRTTGGFKLDDNFADSLIDAETFEIHQGYYEGSNVSPMREMANLITVNRAYEAHTSNIKKFDTLLGKVIDTFGPR